LVADKPREQYIETYLRSSQRPTAQSQLLGRKNSEPTAQIKAGRPLRQRCAQPQLPPASYVRMQHDHTTKTSTLLHQM
jgi:hypothetical protein